jgi:uncharacterized membrane protein
MAIFENHALELWRWLHVLFGIVWIGMLYYFNFVQTEYFKEADADAKSDALRKLAPRALWWFRYGALLTLLTGLVMLYAIFPRWNVFLVFAGTLGILMFLNVWLVIWPNQSRVIRSETMVVNGQPADKAAPAALARAGCASRHNTLFSVPMLLFMVSSAHLGSDAAGETLLFSMQREPIGLIAGLALILALEANAVWGKVDYIKIAKVGNVIHIGFALTIVLYLIAEYL